MLDLNIVETKRAERSKKIAECMKNYGFNMQKASIHVDNSSPLTTNRAMFAEAGYVVPEKLTPESNNDIIRAYSELGVMLVYKENVKPKALCVTLTNILDEIITECWGGEGMQEVIELHP